MPLRLPYSSNLQSMWGLRHAESPGAQSETSNDNGGNGDAKNSNNAVQAPHRANHKMSHYRSSNAGSVKNFAIVEVVRHHVKSALPDLKVVEMLRARPLKRHEEQTMPDDGNYSFRPRCEPCSASTHPRFPGAISRPAASVVDKVPFPEHAHLAGRNP
mmetsp:Transcript_88395/g.249077  ORF Transcript_88395/g.249077 Transcript_88395/m.249077 type:complete len:158 (+) Transcript_88395:97-570(+)